MKHLIKKYILNLIGDIRDTEFEIAMRFLSESERVLDVGCGNGRFLSLSPGNVEGIDINPVNVDYCIGKGLKAKFGDATNIPYPDQTFTGVHLSHVLHVFPPDQAIKCLNEMLRVLKKNGCLIITTQNWFKSFFRHPENSRPYPPDALRRLFSEKVGINSPMFNLFPRLEEQYLWLRRTPLIEFSSSSNKNLEAVSTVLNRLQYKLFIRNYFHYDAYLIVLKKCE